MRKRIALLFISLLFLSSCGKQDTAKNTDTREHYLKAKKYYDQYHLRGVQDLTQTDKELEWKLEKYIKTRGELDLALFETTGESREEVMDMIKECSDNIDSIRERLGQRATDIQQDQTYSVGEPSHTYSVEDSAHKSTWTREEMKEAGMEGIGSTQNEAIDDSREEIRHKRPEFGHY